MTNDLIYNFIGYIDIYCLLILRYIFVENKIAYIINKRHHVYFYGMSTEKKNPLKRDQALNDATGGQFGEEPSSQSDTRKDENG